MAAMFLLSSFPTYSFAEAVTGEETAACPICTAEMINGFCAQHPDQGLGLEEADLVTVAATNTQAYRIENAGELLWFAQTFRDGGLETQDAFLTDNIDWQGLADANVNWQPIGSWSEAGSRIAYTGTFNGGGYGIQNLKLEDSADGSLSAVFGYIGQSGTVEALGVDNASVDSSASKASVLAGVNEGTIKNCYVSRSQVTVTAENAVVSDIAAVSSGAITGCYSTVTAVPGQTAEGIAVAAYTVSPICAENQGDPSMVSRNYYLGDGTEAVAVPDGIHAASLDEFNSGSVAAGLNEGQAEPPYDETAALVKKPVEIVPENTESQPESQTDPAESSEPAETEGPTETESPAATESSAETETSAAGNTVPIDSVPEPIPEKQSLTLTLAALAGPIVEDGAAVDASDFVIGGLEGTTGVAAALKFFRAEDTYTEIPAPSAAGSYVVYAVTEETDTYYAAQSEGLAFSIVHGAGIQQDTPATCTEEGQRRTVCEICGAELAPSETLPATGHQYENGVCVVCGAPDELYALTAELIPNYEGGAGAESGWYRGAVKLAAPEGYSISLERDGVYERELSIEPQDGTNTVTYYIKGAAGDPAEKTIEFKADLTAPIITVNIGGINYQETPDAVDFGQYFASDQVIKISGQDGGSGVVSVEYLLVQKELTAEEIAAAALTAYDGAGGIASEEAAAAAWTPYDEAKGIIVSGEGHWVVYVRAYDAAGNERLFHTNGFVIDKTAPTVEGVTAGGVYCPGTQVVVKDSSSVTVTINDSGVGIVLADGAFKLSEAGQQTIKIVDAAGNQTSVQVTVNPDHTWDEGTVTTAPTCMAEGVKTYTCTLCGEQKTEVIPAAAHKYTNYVYNNDATCQKDGTKTAACDYGCGTKDTVTAEGTKTGHSFTNYVYNKDASCRSDGTKTAVCDYGCGASDTITAPNTKLAHTYDANGVCTVCGTQDPARATTAAVTTAANAANATDASGQPILGIEDFSGVWGIVLICAGVAIVVVIIVLVAVKRRG